MFLSLSSASHNPLVRVKPHASGTRGDAATLRKLLPELCLGILFQDQIHLM